MRHLRLQRKAQQLSCPSTTPAGAHAAAHIPPSQASIEQRHSLEGHKDSGWLDGAVPLGDAVPLQRLPTKHQPRACRNVSKKTSSC